MTALLRPFFVRRFTQAAEGTACFTQESICENGELTSETLTCSANGACHSTKAPCPNNLLCNATGDACLAQCSATNDCTKGSICNNGKCELCDSCQSLLVEVSADAWIEGLGKNGNQKYLIVGKTGTYPIKRSLLRFEITTFPKGYSIVSAEMDVYLHASNKPSWIDEKLLKRKVVAHQVLQSWTETGVNAYATGTGVQWSVPYLGLNGKDADSSVLDTQIWEDLNGDQKLTGPAETGYRTFNVTAAAKAWVANPATNHGILLFATNEKEPGHDIRMRSREYGTDPPLLRIYMTKEPPSSVPTYKKDAQPIFVKYCSGCHSGETLGGHNIASEWKDAFNKAKNLQCFGMNVGQCAIVRIKNGDMPLGAPPGTVDEKSFDILSAWVEGGMKY